MASRECKVEGCDKKHHAHGYCQTHAWAWKKYGDPLLRTGRPTGEKHPRWKGGERIDSYGYARVYLGNGQYRAKHRVVMEQILGRPLLPDENVHHINGIKHDNRPENLELWVRPQPTGVRVSDLVARYTLVEGLPMWAVMC